MIPIRSFIAALGLAALALPATAQESKYDPNNVLPSRTLNAPFGINLKTHNWNTKTLDEVHAMGFRAFRRGIYWRVVESEKGKYDFSGWDQELAHARKLGLKPLLVFFGGNKLYGGTGAIMFRKESNRRAFAKFVAATVEHYKGQGILFEIWNEPNVRTFWHKDGKANGDEFATEYTNLVKACMEEVNKVAPDEFIMAGSVSNYWQPSYEWTELCFQKGILETGISGWSVHPYGVRTPEEFKAGHDITRNLLKKYGHPDMPMLQTERGFSIGKTTGGAFADEGWSGGPTDQAEVFQAWNLVRQFMIDQMCGIRLEIWYEFDGEKFGIAGDMVKRPANKAARVMLEQMKGFTYDRRVEADYELDYLLLFKKEDGTQKLVAWTAPAPGGLPTDARKHSVTVEGVTGPVTLTDIYGNASKSAAGPLTLDLAPSVVYVDLPAGVNPTGAKMVPGTLQLPEGLIVAKTPEEAGGKALGLFTQAAGWKFNPAKGAKVKEAFTQDGGKDVLAIDYDFSAAGNGMHVLNNVVKANIAKGSDALFFAARADVPTSMTVRMKDATGQTLISKLRIKGLNEWEEVKVPLTGKFEGWGGANDGKIHFPIKSLNLTVVGRGGQNPNKPNQGKLELADAYVK
ncbi:MAG: hypothetical protein AAGK14_04385 [Verrucomicrobiota bacterium]